jgi:hypothetical protein
MYIVNKKEKTYPLQTPAHSTTTLSSPVNELVERVKGRGVLVVGGDDNE